MSDLHELAAVVRTSDHKKRQEQPGNTKRRRLQSLVKNRLLLFLSGLAIGYFLSPGIGDNHNSSLKAVGISRVLASDPEFTIESRTTDNGGFLAYAYWTITNKSTSALVISDVRLNGEKTAPLAQTHGGWTAPDPQKLFPVTLSVGESAEFFQYNSAAPDVSYQKSVVFVDVYTNRGKFRHEPKRGLDLLENLGNK